MKAQNVIIRLDFIGSPWLLGLSEKNKVLKIHDYKNLIL